MPDNTFYPNLVRHLFAARDLENARKHILPQSCSTSMCCERFREYPRTNLPQSCSTSMCCERLRECPKTHFTPILFDIYVLREIQRMLDNTFYANLVRHLCAARDLENTREKNYPNLVRHLCAARDSENARKHILPQSCSTSVCCERFRECSITHFTPILFDIDVLRET